MSMIKGNKIPRGYATVSDADGSNYRTIAEAMTRHGHQMNHSSARNYVLRAFRKFAVAILKENGKTFSEEKIEELIKDPGFQSGVAAILETLSDK